MFAVPEPDETPADSSPAAGAPMFDADGALSRSYLLQRGYCCELGCRNCPYRDSADVSREA
jgi:hypothetical protein